MRGTFKQAQVFLSVAEAGSFSAAARMLGISQPAVSKHIALLESNFGALFVRRSGARVRLNANGELLHRSFSAMRSEISKIEKGREQEEVATINVGAGHYLADCIRNGLVDFLVEQPFISVQVQVVSTEMEAFEGLQKNTIDLAYMTRLSPELPHGVELIQEVPAAIFGKPELLAATGRSIPVVVPAIGSPEEWFILRFLQDLKIPYHVIARAQHFRTALDLAVRGVGCCFAFNETAQQEVASGSLVQLPSSEMNLYRCAYRAPRTNLDVNVQRLNDYIKLYLKGLAN
jgi:DNA-binding transcriptional LysR family regulator